MTNINMEVVSTASRYVMGERRETPHVRGRHTSPGWGRVGRRACGTCVNGPPKSDPRLVGL
jgi:hypothetical protein